MRLAQNPGIPFVVVVSLFASIFLAPLNFGENIPQDPDRTQEIAITMRQIHREVKEMAKPDEGAFLKREFAVGEDDDDTNKDIHAVILIQKIQGMDRVTVLVTYFERDKELPIIAVAKNTKTFAYVTLGESVRVLQSDYKDRQLVSFLPELYRAILNKKKLLRLIKKAQDHG